MRAKRHRPQRTLGPDQGFCFSQKSGPVRVRARWIRKDLYMIEDLYRNDIRLGEINNSPSMTEPARIYSISELLARPELILRSRSGYAEEEVDISDPSAMDRVSDPQDIQDPWDFEVPRDPDFYNLRPRKRTPAPSPAKSSKPQAEPVDRPGNIDGVPGGHPEGEVAASE